MSPRDNFDTSPNIIKLRNAGNVSRLNMEIAILPSDQVKEQSGGAASGASIAVAEIANQTGGFGGGAGCFTGETLVWMKFGHRRIDGVKLGDHVVGFNERRERVEAVVTECFIHEVLELLRIELEDGRVLNVTPEHLMYDGDGFKAAGEFKANDWFYTHEFTVIEIRNVYRMTFDKPVLVYNIETTAENYFAGNIAVHNRKDPDELE